MRTNEEKRSIVEEAMIPGASVAAIARKHGVNANLLFGWCRLHQRGLLTQCREPVSLLPVKMTTPTVASDRKRRAAKQRTTKVPTQEASVNTGHVEVELPGGITVRMRGRVDEAALVAVLTALRGG
jgi:transposase